MNVLLFVGVTKPKWREDKILCLSELKGNKLTIQLHCLGKANRYKYTLTSINMDRLQLVLLS